MKNTHPKLPPELGDGASSHILPFDASDGLIGELVGLWLREGDEKSVTLERVQMTDEEYEALPDC